ncbi:SMI1/KNR4 family protein [Planctomicrobium piriforme]|uniref:SMI1-KNR4 cell-wall n=1 Tax=Planctomicrobium piriforme TaxID=1576369 RepID=A0A1I3QWL3_9PLAN|nr:SMI1/KNR4 family protein [Planctomicrobium piriforme]SFJ38564.1 SMI1-KNR4 cell-wall [Planctomicrobium piriforme]
MDWKQLLERFEFSPTSGPEPIHRIKSLEARIGVALPHDYRDFLQQVGGGELRDAIVPCTVPTPFGAHNLTWLHSVSELIDLLTSTVAPRNMICFSYGHFGMTGCLSIAGIDHGHVYALDTEMRYFWNDERLSCYPHLDPDIKEFFRMRDAEELPERPWGYENCYHMASSFTEFVQKMATGE